MKFKDFINSPVLKTIGKYAGVAVAGIVAVSSAISEQQREQELEDLKKAVSELQNKE